MSEAFRWRLSQNDCQNRGYILDGYPMCYNTALEVFIVQPPPPPPKEVKVDENGEPIEEAAGSEEGKEPEKPKFQQHIYPDSVILLRGSDDYLRQRAAELSAEDNVKWDDASLERRLLQYH